MTKEPKSRRARGPNKVRLLVVVSDLHCGSTMGLCPPDTAVVDGGFWGLNKPQEWLWERWLAFQDWVSRTVGDEPYYLLLNGDMIDGFHHKTKQVIDIDPVWHMRAAIDALGPLAKGARKRFVVIGTEVHVGTMESEIGKQLGAETFDGVHAAQEWTIRMNGIRISARHHMPTTKRKYLEASALGIELGNQQLEAARAGYEIPQIIIAGHRHRFGVYGDGKSMMIACPPYQLLTTFAHKVVPGVVPEVGGFLLDFRGKDDGELPDVRHKLWRTPQVRGAE